MALFRERIKIKLNVGWYSILVMVDMIVLLFIAPPRTAAEEAIQTWNIIGIFGVLLIFVALRPNFGPEANKRIYQAAAGIFAFIIGILMLILGLYVKYLFNIANYAGRGTFPGDFKQTYIIGLTGGDALETYDNLIGTSNILIICAIIIIITSVIRNKIGLFTASILILASTIGYLVGLTMFRFYWVELDNHFQEYDNEYWTQLQIVKNDPGIFPLGMVLVILQGIAFALMLYATFSAKPIEEWRRKRDQSIAAAEVATREGRLPQAVKYLEAAAMWSSKIDEEDKSIELLTRVKQIKDKAIKMRKAKAAQKAKKDYDHQNKSAKRKKVEKKKKPEMKKAPPKEKVQKKTSKKAQKID